MMIVIKVTELTIQIVGTLVPVRDVRDVCTVVPVMADMKMVKPETLLIVVTVYQ